MQLPEYQFGIAPRPALLGKAHIKDVAEDFVVQEIGLGGEVANLQPSTTPPTANWPLTRATLVKRNLSTTEARHLLAGALGCAPGAIGVAGMKDVTAVTSQFVTLTHLSAEVLGRSLPGGLVLGDFCQAEEILRTGDLTGNQFAIVARLEKPQDPGLVEQTLTQLAVSGFPNFFGKQRFGPRGINHLVGEQLLRGNYDQALHILLTQTSTQEPAEARDLRLAAEANWGNWEAMQLLFSSHPHEYRSELIALHILEQGGSALDFWKAVSPQTRFFAYSFGSYLFNQALSQLLIAGKALPQTIPTISAEKHSLLFYQETLGLDLTEFDLVQAALPSIQPKLWELPSTTTAQQLQWQLTEATLTLTFILPKGSYATSLLGELFSLT